MLYIYDVLHNIQYLKLFISTPSVITQKFIFLAHASFWYSHEEFRHLDTDL